VTSDFRRNSGVFIIRQNSFTCVVFYTDGLFWS